MADGTHLEVTYDPVDIVASKSLSAGNYGLLNKGPAVVNVWLRDAAIGDVADLDERDAIPLDPSPYGRPFGVNTTGADAIYVAIVPSGYRYRAGRTPSPPSVVLAIFPVG